MNSGASVVNHVCLIVPVDFGRQPLCDRNSRTTLSPIAS